MLDAVCLLALSREISHAALGMKIEKIQQPEHDLLILRLRGNDAGRRLLISARAGSARLHFTDAGYENPQSPPMFCMLLRKHLTGARVADVRQEDMERAVIIELDSCNDFGEMGKRRLIVELMGRSPNVILCAQDGLIIDCLRRTGTGMSEKRRLLPGLFYENPPKGEKPSFFGLEEKELEAVFNEPVLGARADEWLVKSFFGLSPLISRELCHRALGEVSPMLCGKPEDARELMAQAVCLREAVKKGEFTPVMLLEDGMPRDFSFMDIRQYETFMERKEYTDFSALLDDFFTLWERADHQRRRSSDLTKTVKTARERLARKLIRQREDFEKTLEREELKLHGDLITANIYRLKKDMESFETENFYLEGSPTVQIVLDPTKTPQQNAQAYYKQYAKAKTANIRLSEQIGRTRRELDYLDSVLEEISRAQGERELDEIRSELAGGGFIKKRGEGKAAPKTGPLRFVSSAGFEIYVGRNNRQNDEMTKTAPRGDIWLHVQKAHGAHVIIRCAREEPDEKTLSEAASLAAYYSQARLGGKTAVDYTHVKNVKKPGGSFPGMVVYTDYQTIIAEADEEITQKLKIKTRE